MCVVGLSDQTSVFESCTPLCPFILAARGGVLPRARVGVNPERGMRRLFFIYSVDFVRLFVLFALCSLLSLSLGSLDSLSLSLVMLLTRSYVITSRKTMSLFRLCHSLYINEI